MELAVKVRTQFGKSVKTLRNKGIIPAELYGHGVPNVHLSVDAKEFRKVFREAGENTVIQLAIEGKQHPALIHDVTENYVSGSVDHIDFYQIRMDEKLTAKVPIEFIGEAPAVKNLAGILNTTMAEIEVEALPADLPHRLTADLSSLTELNQSLYVKDIPVPKGVKFLVDMGTAIATVTPPLKEEEVVEKPALEVADVKVETEEKKAEREKGKEREESKE